MNKLYITWICVLIIVVAVSISFKGESTNFYGIAESKGIAINNETSVEIKRIHVMPGQEVRRGDILVEFERPDLTKRIALVESQIRELNKQKSTYADMDEIQGMPQLRIELENLKAERSLLQKEKEMLRVYAQIDGIIGSVNFSEGENVIPFSTVMTLHTKTPSYIKGYIHEKAYNRIKIGQNVKVCSISDVHNKISGVAVGIGARIVEYPKRLRKIKEIRVWGREVLIKIPKDNNLLLGEKVIIRSRPDKRITAIFRRIISAFTHGSEEEKFSKIITSRAFDIQKIGGMEETVNIEASGILYLSDLKQYLVVSDETDKNTPCLFLMDGRGNVRQKICVEGLNKIIDMECVTFDPKDNVYLMASQSFNKSNVISNPRKIFARVKREGNFLKLDKHVYLFDILLSAANKWPDKSWAKFFRSGIDVYNIEIEGIFYYNNSIYFGFKRPLKNNKSVIIKIKDIANVFEEKDLKENSIAIWKELDLTDKEAGLPTGISDMCINKNNVYIVSYVNITRPGNWNNNANVWKYDMKTDLLTNIKQLRNMTPEGITYNTDYNELFITFDNGRALPSQAMTLKEVE